jgi:hypothetical protein
MTLSYVNAPTPGAPRIPFVRRIKAGQTFQCQIGWKCPYWVYTHYSGKTGTTVCRSVRNADGTILEESACDGCKAGRPERPKGYLWVFAYLTKSCEWLEITPHTWDCVVTQGGKIEDYRGYELKISRGNGSKARLFVALEEPRQSVNIAGFRVPPDPEAALVKVMG